MEEILENDRQFGEDDYGDKREEANALHYVTAKFGGKMKNAKAAEDGDESIEEQKENNQ